MVVVSDESDAGAAKACCYKPVERLGSGGMGEVWRARHGMLDRPAAIKFIRPERLAVGDGVSAKRTREQFEREAQATASLTSPHTIDLFDFGVSEEGQFYYVMELLDGIDLRSLVRRFGPIPADRAIHFLRQTCHSLAEAHAAGLIHRDVKPANIYTCRRGLDHDFVKVLDFGLVVRSDDLEGGGSDLVAGTPAFMAPEIVTGSRRMDGRSDIYSLGCVAYWLVTGQPVFEGASVSEVIRRHVEDPPQPFAEKTEMDVPVEFERVVLDCLQKDAEQRPRTAGDLAARLSDCESVAGTWTSDQAAYWWALHRPTAGIAGESTRSHLQS